MIRKGHTYTRRQPPLFLLPPSTTLNNQPDNFDKKQCGHRSPPLGLVSYHIGMCSWCLYITYPCLFSLSNSADDNRSEKNAIARSDTSFSPPFHRLIHTPKAPAAEYKRPSIMQPMAMCIYGEQRCFAGPRRNVIRALLHDFVSKTVLGLPNSLSRLQGLNRRRIAARCPSLAGALVIFAGSLPVSLFFF